jgi:hypothetical protein
VYSLYPYSAVSPWPEESSFGEDPVAEIPASTLTPSVQLAPMKNTVVSILLGLTALLCLPGCSIVKSVSAVQPGVTIDKIYVERNKNMHMEGLHPELLQQFRSLGFQVESYDGAPPAGAVYTFVYTANWNWDMAMYLTYFQGTLMENGKVLGRVEYDSRRGGANMGKFGKTAEKIRPLLIDLLSNATRVKSNAAATGER